MRARWLADVALLTAALSILGLVVGCGSRSKDGVSPSATNASEDSSLNRVLGEMPRGEVLTPTEVMELGGDVSSVLLAGRIDAGEIDPFQPGELAFMISQLPDEGHGAEDPDHADNCPFCKRKLSKAPRAIVQFRDSDGNVLAGDPRRELAVDKGDVVFITGEARYDESVNTVMVNATGVFRKADQ